MLTFNPDISVTNLVEELRQLHNKFALQVKHGEHWENLRTLAGDIRKVMELIDAKLNNSQQEKNLAAS